MARNLKLFLELRIILFGHNDLQCVGLVSASSVSTVQDVQQDRNRNDICRSAKD